MEKCFYCEENEKLQSLMIKITDLKWSKVYLNRNQTHPGRCIVACKEHTAEYFHLPPEANSGFFAEVSMVAKAINNIFKPAKINYATYGDLVPHVHFHLVPKYRDKPHWGVPFQDDPKETLNDNDYSERIAKIKAELDRLVK